MKKIGILFVGFLLVVSVGLAGATTYVEDFEDPFPQWESNWLGVNSDLTNVYGVGEGRGNNPDGLWIGNNPINFLNGFGDNATFFSIDIATWTSNINFQLFDKDNVLFYSQIIVATSGAYTDPGVYDTHSLSLSNGLSSIFFNGSPIEGFTSIDNVELQTGGSAVPEPATMLLFGLGLLGLAGVSRKKQ